MVQNIVASQMQTIAMVVGVGRKPCMTLMDSPMDQQGFFNMM